MHRTLRVVRGVIGISVTFGALWGLFGAVLGWTIEGVFGFRGPDCDAACLADEALTGLAVMGATGAIIGAGFALLLSRAGRHLQFEEISYSHVLTIGALTSVALVAAPYLLSKDNHNAPPPFVIVASVVGMLGAGTGAAMLRIARAGRGGPSPRLPANDPPESLGE